MKRETNWNYCAFLVLLVASSVRGDVIIWDESVNGDLSTIQSMPSAFTMTSGQINILSGTVGGGDRDWVTLTVPSGSLLSNLVLASYSGADGTAFIGVQGSAVFIGMADIDPTAYLGYTHFGPTPGNVGQDLLPAMGIAAMAQGFTPPLPAGDYAFYIRQAVTPNTYQFNFNVTPVPEPASITMLALVTSAIGGRAWSIRKSTPP